MIDDIMQTNICVQNRSKDFHELSYSKQDNSYVVKKDSEAGKIFAVDFDAVKEQWYTSEKYPGGRPCSADALFCKDNKIYLIEFKTGKLNHSERKLYDSILMMVENFGVTVQQFRDLGTYIVVTTKWQAKNDCDESISRAAQFMKESWSDSCLTHQKDIKNIGLANLSGVVVSKVYGMSPKEFDIFVKLSQWK